MRARSGAPARLAALLAAALAAACGAREDVAEAPLPVSRRGDPQPWVPPPTDGPPLSGRAVGVVAAGSSTDVVVAALRVIQAMLDEDVEATMAAIAEEVSIGRTGRTVGREMLRRHFESQFALLDYHQLTLEEAVDRDAIEVVPYEASVEPTPGDGSLRPGDVLVRLSMRITQRNRRRYFEDTYEWWFRQVAGRWQIVAWGR